MKPKTKKTSPMESKSRSSHLVIEVTSFGTEDQHLQTINSILSELELRRYAHKLIAIRPAAK